MTLGNLIMDTSESHMKKCLKNNQLIASVGSHPKPDRGHLPFSGKVKPEERAFVCWLEQRAERSLHLFLGGNNVTAINCCVTSI